MSHFVVKFKKLHADARMPTRAYEDDYGWDVYSVSEDIFIALGETVEIKLGIAFEVPSGLGYVIATKSRHLRAGLVCHRSTMDAGYRNEISVWICNERCQEGFTIRKGDQVAQLLFREIPKIIFKEVSELNKSERGLRGYGSSGNN